MPFRNAAFAPAILFSVLATCPAHAAPETYPIVEACAADTSMANINELKSKGGSTNPTLDFVEIKILADATDLSGWTLCTSDQPGAIECQDVGVGNGTWYTQSQTVGEPDDSQAIYDNNTWITFNFKKLKAEEGEAILYDSSGNVLDYIRWSGQAGICNSTNFSWDVPAACGNCFDNRDPNEKDFARTEPDGTGDWGNNGDEPSEGDTNDDPASPQADHFAIVHDGIGINCQPEPITIEAHQADHSLLTTYVTAVDLSTSTLHGDWSVIAGNGTLVNNGNGSASYQFVDADNGQVTLGLHDTYVETANINVTDGIAGDVAGEDPDIAFNRAGFGFRSNGAAGNIPNQIAGKPSDTGAGATALELVAIETNTATGACEALLTGPQAVDFALECNNPGSCNGSQATISGTTIANNDDGSALNYAPVSLDFGDATDDSATFVFTYPDAGEVTLHARLDPTFTSGEVLAGASTFVVRPFGFELVASGGSVSASNPAAAGAAGPVFTAAGETFRIDARAVQWQAVDDVNNDGIPDTFNDTDPATFTLLSDNATTANFGNESVAPIIRLGAYLAAPTDGIDPNLSGVTAITGFSGGTAFTADSRIDDVGIYEITSTMDANNYLGGNDVLGASGYVGRVIPAWFEVQVPVHGCDDAAGFTYSRQEIGQTVITATSALGSGNVTLNYDGVNQAVDFSKDTTISDASGAAGTVTNAVVAANDFDRGIATRNSSEYVAGGSGVVFSFTTEPSEPTGIVLRATDTDGVSSAGYIEEGTEIRSGRFSVRDTVSATTIDAQVPVAAESWQELAPGSFEWSTNPDHSCWSPALADFGLADYAGNLATGETGLANLVFVDGGGTLTLSAPGPGNNGSVDVTAAIPGWLEFIDGSGNSSATGHLQFFGIFTSEEGFINRREVVQ